MSDMATTTTSSLGNYAASASAWQGLGLVALECVPVFWPRPQRDASRSLPIFQIATSGAVLALEPSSSWRWVAPMLARRLLSRPLAVGWPRLLLGWNHQGSSQSQATNDKNKKDKAPSSLAFTSWLQVLVDGGPLGPGCAKLVHAALGVGLYAVWAPSLLQDYWRCGSILPPQAPWLPAVVAGVSIAVNGVLWLWSYLQKSRGNHDGLNQLVAPTLDRALTVGERLQLALWATLNAACEEVAYRVLLRADLAALWQMPAHESSSNFAQAVVFGLAHYHGIPSGWTGVALTLVYGGIMGAMADMGQGLLYPIVAHAVADYYIFATIARRKL